MQQPRPGDRRVGWAWFGLCVALALHVTDEALTDFLSVYNPTVESLKQRLPWLPLPTFQFRTWLDGLVAAVVLLVGVTPLISRGVQMLRVLAYPFGVLMALNALGHLTGSLVLGRLLPGVYSSPVLLMASMYLLFQLARSRSSGIRATS